jgi:uncharacterized membrane protein YvbJ
MERQETVKKNQEENTMAYCKNCGQPIDDYAVICPKCGVAQQPINQVVDSGSVGWAFLGFCIPLVGLILFLVWKDTKPLSAKKAGIGALISVCVIVVIYILVAIIGIGAASRSPAIPIINRY